MLINDGTIIEDLAHILKNDLDIPQLFSNEEKIKCAEEINA